MVELYRVQERLSRWNAGTMPANRPQDAGAPARVRSKTKRADQRPPSLANPETEAAQIFSRISGAGRMSALRPIDQLAAATLEISGFLIAPSGLLAASTLTGCKLVASSTLSLRSNFAGFSVAAFC